MSGHLRFLPSLTLLGTALALAGPASGQRVLLDDEWCDEGGQSDQYCEVREYSLNARDLVRVDAEPNGGIRVEAWDRNEISLRAKVQAWSRRGDPAEIAGKVRVETGGTITADGPDMERREGWSVSFHLLVPRNSDLDLESVNGGIRILGVHGEMRFETKNGGIHLEDVGGDVRGETRNGGVSVDLSGAQWEGNGLDVRTTNGGATLTLPEGFRADLETGTVNGGFTTDFPITVRGELRSNRISTQLNGGGPPIHISTTNGAIRIKAR
jgi:hypothetical protein